jgi:hypothetical protein
MKIKSRKETKSFEETKSYMAEKGLLPKIGLEGADPKRVRDWTDEEVYRAMLWQASTPEQPDDRKPGWWQTESSYLSGLAKRPFEASLLAGVGGITPGAGRAMQRTKQFLKKI